MVGLFVMSSGRTHLANIAFCLGDNGNFPHLSLDLGEKGRNNRLEKLLTTSQVMHTSDRWCKMCIEQLHSWKRNSENKVDNLVGKNRKY